VLLAQSTEKESPEP